MRISDWSSDVCSSDLTDQPPSIGRSTPVIYFASSEARKSAPLAMSIGLPSFPMGIWLVCCFSTSGGPFAVIGVRSEERRVGKVGVSTCRSWGTLYTCTTIQHSDRSDRHIHILQ